MTNCRCAKCRRREIYKATGMTLSLAWNKRLRGTCNFDKLTRNAKRQRPDSSDSQGGSVVKEAP